MPIPPPPDAKKVFEGILASAYQWKQKLYDGSTTTFECYTRADTATVIPFLDAQTVLLTKQEQPQKPEAFWDPPGGRADPGETLEEAARRELHEETGYKAGRLMLWSHRKYAGMLRFEQAIYVATDLILDPKGNKEDRGERIKLVPTKWDDVIRMCLKREMRQQEVMLVLLGMHYDPEQRKKLDAFLAGR